MNFEITHVGVYRHVQKLTQTVETNWINFSVTGWIVSRITFPGGEKYTFDPKSSYLMLLPPGAVAEAEFSNRRENWVLMLKTEDLRYVPETRQTELRDGGVWLPIPHIVEVPREWVPRWQVEFQSLQQAFQSQLPRDRLRARIAVFSILRYMLERQPEGLRETPARAFKRRIDRDEKFEHSLGELSSECGYSSDHLRVLFEQEFRISPLAYRSQLRMSRAMQLIASSRLPVKEIAAMTGFSQVSHFSAVFRKAFQISPREAVHRYRHAN
ncbi:MAG TPA: helix-turn-helix transcriptional regulator [Planctomycetota bacterium]|nr:helix-turn-helix transcriptional regulator [Planctomycetota bacterium]